MFLERSWACREETRLLVAGPHRRSARIFPGGGRNTGRYRELWPSCSCTSCQNGYAIRTGKNRGKRPVRLTGAISCYRSGNRRLGISRNPPGVLGSGTALFPARPGFSRLVTGFLPLPPGNGCRRVLRYKSRWCIRWVSW